MIEILKTTKEDIFDIVRLEEELLDSSIGSEMLLSELHNKYAHFLTAKLENQVIGYIGGWIIEGECELINFVVDKKHQRQKVGTKLLEKIIEISHENNASKIILEVKKTNLQAIGFYKHHHFYEIGIRKNYYPDGTDALLMRKELM